VTEDMSENGGPASKEKGRACAERKDVTKKRSMERVYVLTRRNDKSAKKVERAQNRTPKPLLRTGWSSSSTDQSSSYGGSILRGVQMAKNASALERTSRHQRRRSNAERRAESCRTHRWGR
jgi:hypothetical protein